VRYGQPAGERLCLHAAELAFPHPQRQQEVRCTAPLPALFAALVGGARADAGGPTRPDRGRRRSPRKSRARGLPGA
jgi:hypothetical protein